MAKFTIPKQMVQISQINPEWHFISSHDKRELFTICGKVAYNRPKEYIRILPIAKVPAKDICKKCKGGMIVND